MIYENNDENLIAYLAFIKLTGTTPNPKNFKLNTNVNDSDMIDIIKKYPALSSECLKKIHSVLNKEEKIKLLNSVIQNYDVLKEHVTNIRYLEKFTIPEIKIIIETVLTKHPDLSLNIPNLIPRGFDKELYIKKLKLNKEIEEQAISTLIMSNLI